MGDSRGKLKVDFGPQLQGLLTNDLEDELANYLYKRAPALKPSTDLWVSRKICSHHQPVR